MPELCPLPRSSYISQVRSEWKFLLHHHSCGVELPAKPHRVPHGRNGTTTEIRCLLVISQEAHGIGNPVRELADRLVVPVCTSPGLQGSIQGCAMQQGVGHPLTDLFGRFVVVLAVCYLAEQVEQEVIVSVCRPTVNEAALHLEHIEQRVERAVRNHGQLRVIRSQLRELFLPVLRHWFQGC
ncbi:hypothetical protein ND051 (plasmid) [Pseudomonas putida ND6]|uniref:Uncharacterized protein n=1 Tax=Pseudomonas putida ND6 TaxID=231023 RepID=Q6XUK1_PSEPU|nr:hypothetical protein ND051 [Pseudomonas putida ND6]